MNAYGISVPADVTTAGGQSGADHQSLNIVNTDMGSNNFDKIQAIISATTDGTNCPIPGVVTFTSTSGSNNISVTGLADACEYTFELSALCDSDTLQSVNNVSKNYCTG